MTATAAGTKEAATFFTISTEDAPGYGAGPMKGYGIIDNILMAANVVVGDIETEAQLVLGLYDSVKGGNEANLLLLLLNVDKFTIGVRAFGVTVAYEIDRVYAVDDEVLVLMSIDSANMKLHYSIGDAAGVIDLSADFAKMRIWDGVSFIVNPGLYFNNFTGKIGDIAVWLDKFSPVDKDPAITVRSKVARPCAIDALPELKNFMDDVKSIDGHEPDYWMRTADGLDAINSEDTVGGWQKVKKFALNPTFT